MNKCNYCEKDSKAKLIILDQGKIKTIFFCEDHLKNKSTNDSLPEKVGKEEKEDEILKNFPNKQVDLLKEDNDEEGINDDCFFINGDNLTDDHLMKIEEKFYEEYKADLKKQLDFAIKNRDYIRATEIRDQLKDFERKGSSEDEQNL